MHFLELINLEWKEMESFKITYIGGIGRVTGSCTLVQHNQNKFLIDCGMIQGEAHADHENEQPFPFNPQDIKYVILTLSLIHI